VALFGAVSTNILHFRARVLVVVAQDCLSAASEPSDPFGTRARATAQPSSARLSPSETNGPRDSATIRAVRHSVVMRLCRVTDTPCRSLID
jgi:hypothetical protein